MTCTTTAGRLRRVLACGLLLGTLPATAQAQGDADRSYLERVINRVLESERSNDRVAWSNDESGARGTVMVERTFYLDPKTPCRDYTWTRREPDGTRTTARGTGCRTGSGRWQLDEQAPVVEARSDPAPAPAPAPPAADCKCPPPEADEPEPFAEYTLPERTEF